MIPNIFRFLSLTSMAPMGLVCALALLLPLSAAGQESRASLIAAQQAAKAAAQAPAALSKGERRFVDFKNNLAAPPSGLFPAFGTVLSGGGLAAGPGYRYLVNDTTAIITKGLWSIRNYRQVDAMIDSRGLAGGHLDLQVDGGWRTAPTMAFYGTGMQPELRPVAGEDDVDDHGRTSYYLRQSWAGGMLRARPQRFLRLGGGFSGEYFDIGAGGGGHPSIEERFTEAEAPGQGRDHTFLHTQGTFGIDWRPAPGYARRGGLYTVTLHDYHDTSDEFSFRRLDADVVQHLPVLRESLILSLRGRLYSILGDDDVPFFLLPSLGGSHSLRGFPSLRFRDRHSMLVSAEYRWTPSRAALDAAIFVDSGKVTSSRDDLDFHGLKTSVGIGLRLHTLIATPLRVEFARSNEGMRLIFSSSAAF